MGKRSWRIRKRRAMQREQSRELEVTCALNWCIANIAKNIPEINPLTHPGNYYRQSQSRFVFICIYIKAATYLKRRKNAYQYN